MDAIVSKLIYLALLVKRRKYFCADMFL